MLANAFNLKVDELIQYYLNDVGRDALHVIVSGARPLSRGYVQLGGTSPYDSPIIDPNYLGDSDNVDVQVLLEGVKKSMILMENTTAMGLQLDAKFTTVKLPGCEKYEFRSDAYWICFIRRYSITLHHPVGTAAMGKVVDTKLRVLGTKNLRVIDSSIQPVTVATNTQVLPINNKYFFVFYNLENMLYFLCSKGQCNNDRGEGSRYGAKVLEQNQKRGETQGKTDYFFQSEFCIQYLVNLY